jgi:hypothetical protein
MPPLENKAAQHLAAATRASNRVQLVDVAFVALEAKRLDAGVESTEESGPLSFDVKPCDGRWIRDSGELRVLMPYVVDVVAKMKGRTLSVAHFAVVMRLAYALKDPSLDDETLEGFAWITPFMHSWPYLRAQVQELTTKVGLPPLVLPVAVSGHAEGVMRMERIQAPPALAAGAASVSLPGPRKGRRAKDGAKRRA